MNEPKEQQEHEPKYRVHWKSKLTGLKSHGEPMPMIESIIAKNDANAKFPDLDHWIQPAE